MKSSKQLVNKLVKETLEQKYTNASASWSDLIGELSKEIKKPIELDDAGNYNVCECEPYHISIRPIVHGICDVQAFKDYSDRTKKLFMKFDDVKKMSFETYEKKTKVKAVKIINCVILRSASSPVLNLLKRSFIIRPPHHL